MKKLLVFISCLVLAMSLSLTAFATPSPSVLGEVFTNEDGTTEVSCGTKNCGNYV